MNSPIFDSGSRTSEASFTKRDLYNLLFKFKWLILLLWFSVSGLVAYVLVTLPPVYSVEAKVLVKTEQQGRPSLLSGIAAYKDALDTDPSNRKLETEMEVFLSRPIVEQVVKELDIKLTDVYQPPYVHMLAPVARLVDWVLQDLLGFPPGKSHELDDTVDAMLKSIRVAPGASKSGEATPNVFVIRFQAAKSSVAYDVLDRWLGLYLQYSNTQDQRYGEKAYSIVEQRVQSAADMVVAAQQKIGVFTKANPEMAYSAGGNVSRSRPVLSADAESSIADSRGGAVPPTGEESSTSVLRARLTQLQLDLAEQKQLYTSKVESVQTLESTVKQVADRLSMQVNRDSNRAVAYASLQRDLQLAEDNFFDLKRKLTQIALFLEMNPGQASSRIVVDPPRRPDSSEWKKSVVVGIAISIAGLLLGLGFATFLEYSDHRVSGPRDVMLHLDIPSLTVIDMLDRDQFERVFSTGLREGQR